jgi:hypothetical protein
MATEPKVVDVGEALIIVIPKPKDVEIKDLDALTARSTDVCGGCKGKDKNIWASLKSVF